MDYSNEALVVGQDPKAFLQRFARGFSAFTGEARCIFMDAIFHLNGKRIISNLKKSAPLLALLSVQPAFADEAQAPPQFNLSATITDGRPQAVPSNAEYFGYGKNLTRITDRSGSFSAPGVPNVQIRRRYDLDQPGLACFDTLALDGTRGRCWIDLRSEIKLGIFHHVYCYRAWGLLNI